MPDHGTYPIPPQFANAHITPESYATMYRQSLEDPDTFWAQRAGEFLTWDQPWTRLSDNDISQGKANWFVDGKLNVSVNCIDRHLPERAEQTALIWEGDDPSQSSHISYSELKNKVCRLANVLRDRGVQKGDRVCIYMPMIPEATYAMLACARIGAVHSVVFGGFSPEALQSRINDADCRMVITADEGVRAGKKIPLKANVDIALQSCSDVDSVIVVNRTGGSISWVEGRDVWYHEATAAAANECAPESMDAERIPCSYCTHRALPAVPKAFCTQPVATYFRRQ